MKLTLEALGVLDAIERKGSFAGAADELGRVPSALTYTVRKLEEDMDLLLFDRRARKATLTPAGRELLEQGRLLLRAAGDLERRVQRVATGWEPELRIAFDAILPLSALHPLISTFQALAPGTRLRFSQEVLGGAWEAIKMNRADMVIGAAGQVVNNADVRATRIGDLRMIFAVAPSHPLAKAAEPISEELLLQHRVVAIADSSRQAVPMTLGILDGQQVLTVPDMQSKLEAQIAGLGVGQLPLAWVATHLASGNLIEKKIAHAREPIPVYLLTPKRVQGKAMKWWIESLTGSKCLQHWLR